MVAVQPSTSWAWTQGILQADSCSTKIVLYSGLGLALVALAEAVTNLALSIFSCCRHTHSEESSVAKLQRAFAERHVQANQWAYDNLSRLELSSGATSKLHANQELLSTNYPHITDSYKAKYVDADDPQRNRALWEQRSLAHQDETLFNISPIATTHEEQISVDMDIAFYRWAYCARADNSLTSPLMECLRRYLVITKQLISNEAYEVKDFYSAYKILLLDFQQKDVPSPTEPNILLSVFP